MYLSKIETNNFRNFKILSVEFNEGLTVILGENNIGKTNLMDAIRLVLSTSGPRDIWPTDDDLYHDAAGMRTEHFFEIHLTFKGLKDEELAWFSECLCPQLGERVAQLHMRYEVIQTSSGHAKRKSITWGGETQGSRIDSEILSGIQTTFLAALRDAESDLMPGRKTRIYRLLDHLSSETEQQDLVSKIITANSEIQSSPLVDRATGAINERLADMSGLILGQKASLAISDPTFQRIADSIRARIGTTIPFEITENGLGYNNLLYIATVLGELQGSPDSDLRLLMIEEPEAHLHPQLQTLLADSLASPTTPPVQTILTSHSPTLASHIDVNNISVLYRSSVIIPQSIKSKQISCCSLTTSETNGLSRYLDATKANLFFARGVILVEGISEVLLMSLLAKGISLNNTGTPEHVDLTDYGVSIVNVDGLAFKPFAQLFREGNLEIACSLVTDGDPSLTNEELESFKNGTIPQEEIFDIEFPPTEIGARKSATAETLIALESGSLGVFTAAKTFEYDLALAGNLDIMLETYIGMHPTKGPELSRKISAFQSLRDKSKCFFEHLDPKEKARFAQTLSLKVTSNGRNTGLKPPPYIRSAILHAIGKSELIESANESEGESRRVPVAG